tara:strand:+ start:76 stop:2610 length:2535 start_codon:yes stop_codon:yes gene_type:complete
MLNAAFMLGVPVYKQASASIDQRVADLLLRMTVAHTAQTHTAPRHRNSPVCLCMCPQLEEKVEQMHGDGMVGNPSDLAKRHAKTGLGSIGHHISTIDDLRAQNEVQAAMMDSCRLGIPIDFTAETLHSGGHLGVTIFPMPSLQGASWNVTLVHDIAASNALQARASGTNHGLAPVINVATDPRFGRTQETFGEDPFPVGTMAVASVLGLQGEDGAAGPSTYLGTPGAKIISQAKHFFAYGYGGRDGAAALLDERSLSEVYGRPWRRAIAKAGLRGLMASHNSVNWEPVHGSHRWLTDYLRRELRFGNGYIGADSHDVLALYKNHKVATSIEDAAALAVTAGLDQDLNNIDGTPFGTLVNQSQSAELSAAIDRAAGNVLRLKFAAGLFDQPLANESLWVERDSAPARQLARLAAEEGAVLLINRNKTLPLEKKSQKPMRVAVIGPNADQKDNMLGDYSPSAALSEKAWGDGKQVVTVYSGLRSYVAANRLNASVSWAQGCDISLAPISEQQQAEAVALHRASDVTVLVVGDSTATSAGFTHESCGEGADRQSLDLFGQQMALLNALVAANSSAKLVVVLIHGRPQTFGPDNAALAKVDALVAVWRPGEEGGAALARLLFGDVSPSGKLTQAWPHSAGHVHGPGNPWFQPYQEDGGAKANPNVDGPSSVLFPFGFGLSYAAFKYAPPTLAMQASRAGETVLISVTVRNDGPVDAATVVQIYAGAPVGTPRGITRNQRALVGYTKLKLRVNETRIAEVAIETEDLARYDPHLRQWVVDPGNYTLFAQECAGSFWDGYLMDVEPIPNPPLRDAGRSPATKLDPRSPAGPTWQGVGCVVMGSVQLAVHT